MAKEVQKYKKSLIKELPLIHFKIPLRNLEQKVAHIISLGECCTMEMYCGGPTGYLLRELN